MIYHEQSRMIYGEQRRIIISLIVAMDKNRVIGKNNSLPWKLPQDLARFKSLTLGHAVIMGRKTYESIGKALPGRVNIIVTTSESYSALGCTVVGSLESAIDISKNEEEIFIIGGESIFKQALRFADRLYLTVIDNVFEGDTFFPEFDSTKWQEVSRMDFPISPEASWPFSFLLYEKISQNS